MKHLLLIWAALLGALSWGCNAEVGDTAIYLTVTSDLSSPDEIDRVTVEGTGFDSATIPSADLSTIPLPRAIELQWESGPYGPLRLTVSAYRQGALVVQKKLQTAFVPGFQTYLQVDLARSCAQLFCADGLTCESGRCVTVTKVSPTGPQGSDAGTGALDASSDASTGPYDAGVTGPRISAGPDASASGAGTRSDAGVSADASSGSASDAGTQAPPRDASSTPDASAPPPAAGAGATPTCSIAKPSAGAMVAVGMPFALQGSCSDPETGALSVMLWTSSLDGVVGSGASTSGTLRSAGTHTLRLCAPDPRDTKVVGCGSVQISALTPVAPTARITSLRQGNMDGDFNTSQPIVLQGIGTGVGVTLRWADSLQGDLGMGATATLTKPVAGRHVVTLTATDQFGVQASASRNFTVR